MKVIKGDLIALAKTGAFDVIVHGCNCFCTMSAGIAKSIRNEFPSAFGADCETEKGNRNKLGTITTATIVLPLPQKETTDTKSITPVQLAEPTAESKAAPTKEEDEKTPREHAVVVVNAYTQYHWRGKPTTCLADYDAIRACMRSVREHYAGQRIGYPKIGCGLAGGDCKVVQQIINDELEGQDHTLVEFVPPPPSTKNPRPAKQQKLIFEGVKTK